MRKMKAGIFLGVAMLFAACSASAEIFVDRTIVDFQTAQEQRQDVQVQNKSAETAFVEVEVLEVLNPGTDKEEQKVVTDPASIKLVVSPSKFAIPPNGNKLLRIVNTGEPGDERIYRINIKPVLPPLAGKAESTLVRVVVAYQVLVMVRPVAPEDKLVVKREGRKLLVSNPGNSNVLMSGGKQCGAANKCQELASRRIYAGNSWQVDLPLDAPVSFELTSFKGSYTQQYP